MDWGAWWGPWGHKDSDMAGQLSAQTPWNTHFERRCRSHDQEKQRADLGSLIWGSNCWWALNIFMHSPSSQLDPSNWDQIGPRTPIMMPKTLLRLRCALLKVKHPHIMIKLILKSHQYDRKNSGEVELCSNYSSSRRNFKEKKAKKCKMAWYTSQCDPVHR